VKLELDPIGINQTLFYNGSTLNVYSVTLLDKLVVDKSRIKPKSLLIYGFDSVGMKPIGVITLPIIVGKAMLQTPIHVMPRDLSYNLLK
jgi:hypothetical protein